MNRAAFIDKYKWELYGAVCDAINRSYHGSDNGLFMKRVLDTIDLRLGQAYDALHPQPKPAAVPPPAAPQPPRKA